MGGFQCVCSMLACICILYMCALSCPFRAAFVSFTFILNSVGYDVTDLLVWVFCLFNKFIYYIEEIGTLFEVMFSAFYGPLVFLVNRVPFNVVLFHECLCELLVWFSGGSLNIENFIQ